MCYNFNDLFDVMLVKWRLQKIIKILFNLLKNITCKQMVGGIYFIYNEVLFWEIYDDSLLVKIVDNNKKIQYAK